MKEFKTYEEQIELLKLKGLIILDEAYAKEKLKEENYYNIINGYKELFMNLHKNDTFITDVTFEEESKKREANAQGTKMILLYMLERLYEEYKLQNYVTHEQRDRFFEIYNAYHNLGGNGYGTALWETIEGLDIRNDVDGVSPFVKMLKEMNKRDQY